MCYITELKPDTSHTHNNVAALRQIAKLTAEELAFMLS